MLQGSIQRGLLSSPTRHTAPYRIGVSSSTWTDVTAPSLSSSWWSSWGKREILFSSRSSADHHPSVDYDLVTLSNLCVDVIVPLDTLPASLRGMPKSEALLEYLAQHTPPETAWEVGGNTNTLIAGARLGMRTAALGHIGDDGFGAFLENVLRQENSAICSTMLDDSLFEQRGLQNTLVCYVLVDKETNEHAFCSRYDFGPWPLLGGGKDVATLSGGAERALERTGAVFVNGFVSTRSPRIWCCARRACRRSTGRRWVLDSTLNSTDVRPLIARPDSLTRATRFARSPGVV
jgi:hypothetical protein